MRRGRHAADGSTFVDCAGRNAAGCEGARPALRFRSRCKRRCRLHLSKREPRLKTDRLRIGRRTLQQQGRRCFLYGTTYGGGILNCGAAGCGVVFELTPSSSGPWTETLLHEFSGAADGALPDAGLAIDPHGRLYGTTTNGGELSCNNGGGCGVVFTLMPEGASSTETILHTFEDDASDGGMPQSAITLDRTGNVYGSTEYGGPGSNLGKGT